MTSKPILSTSLIKIRILSLNYIYTKDNYFNLEVWSKSVSRKAIVQPREGCARYIPQSILKIDIIKTQFVEQSMKAKISFFELHTISIRLACSVHRT